MWRRRARGKRLKNHCSAACNPTRRGDKLLSFMKFYVRVTRQVECNILICIRMWRRRARDTRAPPFFLLLLFLWAPWEGAACNPTRGGNKLLWKGCFLGVWVREGCSRCRAIYSFSHQWQYSCINIESWEKIWWRRSMLMTTCCCDLWNIIWRFPWTFHWKLGRGLGKGKDFDKNSY